MQFVIPLTPAEADLTVCDSEIPQPGGITGCQQRPVCRLGWQGQYGGDIHLCRRCLERLVAQGQALLRGGAGGGP